MPSQIQRVMLAKIRSLVEMSAAANSMNHGTTTGNIRESYVTEFIRDILPKGISVTSGILCDYLGGTSRQLDLIATLDSSLPVIAMKDGLSLVPFDSALLAIEIKSVLTRSTLSQVEQQNESISDLRLSNAVPEGERFIVPTMIVSLDTDLSIDTVADWVENTGNTAACCVIGKFFLRSDLSKTIRYTSSGHGSYNESLAFIATLFYSLTYLKETRKFEPVWARFLLENDGQ